MKRCFVLFTLLLSLSASSQTDTAKYSSVFEKITSSLKEYKLDTSAAQNDKVTKKIIELRNLKGGFNVNEAIEYKLEEDKPSAPSAEFNKFAAFMQTGDGRKWLDNAVIWIYRQRFTYKELKQLVKFYKTNAGKKLSADFPIIMMQSLAAGEMIKDVYEKREAKK